MELSTICLRLKGLVVFRGLLCDPVISAFLNLADKASGKEYKALADAYGSFASLLFSKGINWSRYVLESVLQDENYIVKVSAGGSPIDEDTENALSSELDFLQLVSRTRKADIIGNISAFDFLPAWRTDDLDFHAAYRAHLANVRKEGYGIFARYHMFTIDDGKIIPVKYPDPQRLSQLPGYEREREKLIANTKALLNGTPANNVLLYGDAGTGKSSSVKAVANEYCSEGLRLIEVKKNQLYQIPELIDTLAANPLKFIIFIDDLSFTSNDDNFAALKAILEGSVGGKSNNIVVYATSNRRHLIKENMEDRQGSDIHEADTIQELSSLSARFGLTITFQRPDRDRYENIIRELVKQYGIETPAEKLLVKAEAFAIRAGGRSPRVAKQFIELVKSGVPV